MDQDTEERFSFQHARTRMVEDQIRRRGVTDSAVLDAFLRIPRHCFVSEQYQPEAYQDHPLPIGYGQTISQPYIVALMTEQVNLQSSDHVLEIGTGSGYQAAILSCLCERVDTIERVTPLANQAERIFKELKITNVHVHVGDGTLGYPPAAPYDAILVTAGAPQVPLPLKEQLKNKGRLILPVGDRWTQVLQIWVREKGDFINESIIPVVFVPLLGKCGWEEKPQ
ncbi:MAG TPA: protein-L-isoaspartate O-methyltransferase [Anaerolineaceae bacterium]|uniref:Protein-L-isoaspartate O-methyltransferase n=1 Tax=Anaerolinea thermophila TaxID=167964 RepID=A0A101FY94_9CHLR|nr:MAG: Protein-L-isoaspartate O-methyltransferase [Anaerolinea thermophila]HAF62906.1 protein-L-isoaspartate O-methyltransferase [Anaerolineaceae bacterium]